MLQANSAMGQRKTAFYETWPSAVTSSKQPPAQCSQMLLVFYSLINPIPYCLRSSGWDECKSPMVHTQAAKMRTPAILYADRAPFGQFAHQHHLSGSKEQSLPWHSSAELAPGSQSQTAFRKVSGMAKGFEALRSRLIGRDWPLPSSQAKNTGDSRLSEL